MGFLGQNPSSHPYFPTKSKQIQASPEDRGVSAHDQAWFIKHAPTVTNEIVTGHPSTTMQKIWLFRADTKAIFIHC